MKNSKLLVVATLLSLLFLWGCAPSVMVTPAGNAKQYEITVSSQDTVFHDTEEFIQLWHQKARETCGGSNYNVISRDIIRTDDPFEEMVITGIVECQ